MAKAVINLQKESGGIVKISPVDGIGITEVTVPESGELVTKEYVDNSNVPFVANDDRVKTSLNASGTAPIYACRAWVNFNGTGTVAIRASGNVSSITDGGVGDYRVNFTTALPDANYSWTFGVSEADSDSSGYNNTLVSHKTATPTKTTLRIISIYSNYVKYDAINACITIFR